VLTSGLKLCHKTLDGKLDLLIHKKLKGGSLMPWGKGTVGTGGRTSRLERRSTSPTEPNIGSWSLWRWEKLPE
jgi:hypothetical protein